MSYTHAITSNKDKLSVRLIFVSVLTGLVFQSSQTLLSSNSLFIIALLSNLTGWSGCLSFVLNHKLPKFSRHFLLIILYLFIVGLSYGTFFNKVFLTTAIQQDYRYVMYLISGCVFAYSDEMMESFHSIMKAVSVITVALGVYALVFFDYNFANIETREGTWSLNYTFWWAAGACWVYWVFYGMFVKKDIVYSIGPAAVYIILGLLFLKREVIAYIGMIVFFYLFLNKRNMRGSVKTVLFVLALIFIAYSVAPDLFGGVLDLIFNRVSEVDELDEFDRQIESNNYLEAASIAQLVFGNGIGHYFVFNSERGLLNATHLGYVNILYKGGVVFVVFYLVLIGKLISKIFKKNMSPYMKVCLATSLTYIGSLSFGGSWTYTIYPFCFAAPLFYAVTKTERK